MALEASLALSLLFCPFLPCPVAPLLAPDRWKLGELSIPRIKRGAQCLGKWVLMASLQVRSTALLLVLTCWAWVPARLVLGLY